MVADLDIFYIGGIRSWMYCRFIFLRVGNYARFKVSVWELHLSQNIWFKEGKLGFSLKVFRNMALVSLRCLFLALLCICGHAALPSLRDDTTCVTNEHMHLVTASEGGLGVWGPTTHGFQRRFVATKTQFQPLASTDWCLGGNDQRDNIPTVASLRWYKAETQMVELRAFMRTTAKIVTNNIACLDLFGASGKVKSTFEDAGYRSLGYDIKISENHDITAVHGVKTLLAYGMRTHVLMYGFLLWVETGMLFVMQLLPFTFL